MKHRLKIILILSSTVLHAHESPPSTVRYGAYPSPDDINSLTLISGSAPFDDLTKKNFPHLQVFKEYAHKRVAYNQEVLQPYITDKKVRHLFHKTPRPGNLAEFIKSFDDSYPTMEQCKDFIKRFYTLCLLTDCVNKRFSFPLGVKDGCAFTKAADMTSSLAMEIIQEDENIFSAILLIHNATQALAAYQQHRSNEIFQLIDLLGFHDSYKSTNLFLIYISSNIPELIFTFLNLFQALGEVYEAFINDCIKNTTLSVPYRSQPDFLQREEKKTIFYYSFLNQHYPHENKATVLPQLFKSEPDLARTYRYPGKKGSEGYMPFVLFDDIKEQLKLEPLSEESKMLYFKIYNKATNNNTQPIIITLKDFWATAPISITVSPNIPGIVDGYSVPAAKTSKETPIDKDLIQEVKDGVHQLSLQDDKDKKPSSRKKHKKKSSSSSSRKAPQAAAAQAEPVEIETVEVPSSFYKFNRELVTKRVELLDRLLEWEQGLGEECVALNRQGYLVPGNRRHTVFQKYVTKFSSKQKAIEEIIFLHTLPYSLIKTVMSYGKIQQEAANTLNITAPVQVKKGDILTYYQAEIAGKIEGNILQIWHSFLRPIENLPDYLNNILHSLPGLKIENEKLGESDENSFTLVGETQAWNVKDEALYVTVSNDKISYRLFKS